jgi:GH25 family lysozyme M1 (1,4-beta-N-acetylmuramidase)
MKPNTCLVVDVWEGQLEIDEAVLKANGVAGISVRLNDMNGGHHVDTGFAKQWAEAASFVRFPYFVYNPWVSGQANFAWLRENMPEGCTFVAVDIEVRYNGITPSKYGTDVAIFLQLCAAVGWRTMIYTAQWFLGNVIPWPNVDYWWAQYPDGPTYFGQVDTWDELKSVLDISALAKPFNAHIVPGSLKLWQFSGDYLTLPGTVRKIDLNLFYGSEADLRAYVGGGESVPTEPVVETKLYRVKDDLEAGVPPRPYIRDGLPSTVRIRGGAGFVRLPASWMGYVASINTAQAYG